MLVIIAEFLATKDMEEMEFYHICITPANWLFHFLFLKPTSEFPSRNSIKQLGNVFSCSGFPSLLSSWCLWTVFGQSISKITRATCPSSTSCVSNLNNWLQRSSMFYQISRCDWTLLCCRKCRNNNTIHEAYLSYKDLPQPLHYCNCESFQWESWVHMLITKRGFVCLVVSYGRKNSYCLSVSV